ncbi:hypothetical protein KAFR_0B05720 [Kazachstania africana CBS 2517]|uniref:TBP-associated factor 12 n=1 Tax=Kazachstania africana (strain ATCC 22294 / BCRC 22015 / CBS 2517 / CECT 1963 / NBRC 1671 / NRRL Y-8276) TaxID=1071382 RepID=H2AR68_KAZAF|nr:hypothetical protein KAFR_0B05720 [Kazachstania africana CBS 2517]CCF56868.1 hypothetical protein KAFR_0B05720 [Kazachstania africana CBS 2517]
MSSSNAGQSNVPPSDPSANRGITLQKQLMELSARFKSLVQEAKKVGETTPEGKELIMQASKLKALYDNYNKQKQEAMAQAQARNNNANTANVNSSSSANSTEANTSGRSGSSAQFATLIRQALTPEQNQQYDKLVQNFQTRANNIKDKHTFLKQNIDRLVQEIEKQTDAAAKKQLDEKRIELMTNLKAISVEYTNLQQQYNNGKKAFYIECAKKNPDLQRLLQKSTQRVQQQAASPNAQQQPPVKTEAQPQPQPQQQATPSQSSSNANLAASKPRSQSQITNVNAAASNSSSSNKSVIFKQSDPAVPISESISSKTPIPVPYRVNRPTISGGSAMNAAALNTPIMTKLPPYELDTERVMSKRKLRELVKTIGIDEGDGETVIDGDVEELLLDLADDFVTNVTSFACKLAKHRKSDNLETKDIQLHLERNWNIRIPGYSADEIRSTRKWNPTQSYNQKLQSINIDKNGTNIKGTGTSGTGKNASK